MRFDNNLLQTESDKAHTVNNLYVEAYIPRSKSTRSQTEKDGANKLAERRRVHGVDLLFLAVAQVVIVERAARQTHAFRRLVVVNKPLNLNGTRSRQLQQS